MILSDTQKDELFLEHYEKFKTYAKARTWYLANHLDSECVQDFYIKWKVSKVDIRDGESPSQYLWMSFINSMKLTIKRFLYMKRNRDALKVSKPDTTSPSAENYVLPLISFEQMLASLSDKQKKLVLDLIADDDLEATAKRRGVTYGSLKNLKSNWKLNKIFAQYFLGGE